MQDQTMPDIVYGTAWKKEETTRLVEMAVKSGFRAIDTANQPKHYNEPAVGEALANLSAIGINRDDIFLQTKFTPVDGQDHRVPYDPKDSLTLQVQTSFASSLRHLKTDYLDSYLLHGPYGYDSLNKSDLEVWQELENLYETGKVRRIGISNVTARHIEQLINVAKVKPMIVQNRCYASKGWDREVRQICDKYGIIYQGFSLLTANMGALEHPSVLAIAERLQAAPAQIIFRFSQQLGMQPLTGTTSQNHMTLDLESRNFSLSEDEIKVVERIALPV